MKLIKILTSIVLALSCYVMPVKAEGGFITDAGFAVTYWLAAQGLRFSGDLLKFGSGMWDLFQTFLLNKGLTEVDIEALKEKSEQQRYDYDQTGKQIMQIGADLYNYISEFKDWLIQQFTITSNSENDKKIIFSDKIYNDVVIYTGSRMDANGQQVLGTNEPFLGHDVTNSGIFPLDRISYLQNCPGRISFYNYSVNGSFYTLVGCIAFEVPLDYNVNLQPAGTYFVFDEYFARQSWNTLFKANINGKRYYYFSVPFIQNWSWPGTAIEGLPTFDGSSAGLSGNYWYNVTFSPDSAVVGGEVWGADLGAAPTTVSKDANLVTDAPLTNSEEFENFIKNSLVSGWEIATPTDSDVTTDIPSDISDGEVVANWQTIFPFSLPYDYYLLCNLFVADPQRPEFPINILGYEFTYDLSPLDGVIVLFRDGVCILFVAGLIWATKEIIQ